MKEISTHWNDEVSRWICRHLAQIDDKFFKGGSALGVGQPAFDHQHVDIERADIRLLEAFAALQVIDQLRRSHVWVRSHAEGEDFPKGHSEGPDVGLVGENAPTQAFNGQPFDRESAAFGEKLHVLVHEFRETEICDAYLREENDDRDG